MTASLTRRKTGRPLLGARGVRFGLLLCTGLAPATPIDAASPRVAIGYCTEDVEKARAAGFDYAELGVRNFASLSEDEFAAVLRKHEAAGLPTPVGYLFLPPDLKVVGPETDEAREMAYVRTAFARAERLGIGVIVFGSGPARTVPEGYSKEEAFRQLVDFARRISPEARKHGIVLGVEAQRKEETNLINTMAEALTWVEAVRHPNFQLIVDFYHLASEKEDPRILLKAAKHLRHVHFANPIGRVFPREPDEYDYSAFFENLRRIDYQGRISIEARTDHLEADAPKSISFLRAAMASGIKDQNASRNPGDDPEFLRAAAAGDLAREGLARCHRYLHAWLRTADPVSGLIPRNLKDSHYWNGKDSAADNYPFLVLSAALTDRAAFEGRMKEMLAAETRLTRRDGWRRLTDDFSLDTQKLRDPQGDTTRIVFNSAEYVKDGLIPLTEWLGPSPWSRRLVALLDDIWGLAAVATPFGKIPLDGRNTEVGVEVNGDLLQALSRVYWMSGRDEKYLRWACRLADYYLLPEGKHHPSRDFTVLRSRDHGCEIVTGLAELYATLHLAGRLPHGEPWAAKKVQYQPHLHELLDRLLAVGRNEDGLFFNEVNPQTGEIRGKGALADTWGYLGDGFYTVFLVDGTEAYREGAIRPLAALAKRYSGFDWEPNGTPLGSADGYADSIEGALNLLNRVPDSPHAGSVTGWLDSETQVLWSKQGSDGIIEGWHGDGNFARTTLMYCLWKTQGVTIQPWREDVRLGAVPSGNGLKVSVRTQRPWKGRLLFDRPRHADYLKLPLDWPRINQFPEWFVVKAGKTYAVTREVTSQPRVYSAAQMREGVSVESDGRAESRLFVKER